MEEAANLLGGLSWTPRVWRTMGEASAIARDFGHDYVGTEHLLLALIADTEGIAGMVIADMDVSESARARVLEIVRSESYRA